MPTSQPIGTAIYQGKLYNLLYIGDTRRGVRAHLEWRDGRANFWCYVSELTENRDTRYTFSDVEESIPAGDPPF